MNVFNFAMYFWNLEWRTRKYITDTGDYGLQMASSWTALLCQIGQIHRRAISQLS